MEVIIDGVRYAPVVELKEEKKETVKLYCVKNFIGYFTKGITYEYRSDGHIQMDCRDSMFNPTLEKFFENNPQFEGYLFPLVKRDAKVGEWVYVTGDRDESGGVHRYEIEKIYKVFETCDEHHSVWFGDDLKGNVAISDYLVIDGYTEQERCKCCGQVIGE